MPSRSIRSSNSDPESHSGHPECVPPSRERLDSADVKVLKRGEPDKADLLEVDLGSGPLVVKDFGRKAWWVRLLGRIQIAREVRAYRILGPVPGVPRLVGRVDAHAIALEKIDARQLGSAPDRTVGGEHKLGQLRRIMNRIHAAGLVHWDLRARENVLVDDRGSVWVLDFASAMWLPPGSLRHRWLFRWFRLVDESAYLKWKGLLEAGPYTEEEEAFLKRFRFLRSWWFHRRGAWTGKTKPRA